MIHLDLLKRLLPPTSIDPNGPALVAELAAEGKALDAALYRGDQVLAEADPRTTAELLADWERVVGLPDPCVAAAGVKQSTTQRRAAVVARLTMQGGQAPAYYVALAARLGYTVTVTEYRPFRAGISRAGDALTNGPWAHAWRINAPATTVTPFRAGQGSAGDPLNSWGNTVLECVLTRFKPAHTVLLFAYL